MNKKFILAGFMILATSLVACTPETKPETEILVDDNFDVQQESYLTKVSPQVTKVFQSYDEIWSKKWIPTFNGISSGTLAKDEALTNIKEITENYGSLLTEIEALTGGSLNEENTKRFDELKQAFSSFIKSRIEITTKIQKMIEIDEYSSENLNLVVELIGEGDELILKVNELQRKIEKNIGLSVEQEK